MAMLLLYYGYVVVAAMTAVSARREAMLWLRYGYVVAAATAAASARREAALWLPCQSGENKRVCSSYSSLSLLPAS